MDSFLQEWNTEAGVEFNLPVYKKSLGLNNELVELLWQNGEVVLHSQNNGKQNNFDISNPKQFHKTNNQSPSRASDNPESSNHDHESVVASWIDCAINESFEEEFCADLLSEIPPTEANKPSENSYVGKEKLDESVFAPPLPKFKTFSAAAHQQNFAGIAKISNVHLPVKRQVVNRMEQDRVHESSAMTIGSSHCASNHVVNEVDMSWASSGRDLGKNIHRELEMLGQSVTSSSGGSGSSLWKSTIQSNDTSKRKRKIRDAEESECRSDATESAAGNKSFQKSGTGRRTRVAEVHNQSERRRRDRINEKMKALQELIPHSNKSDKASMLDEAIEYMKSLQLQLQLMWMGSGMAPMMLPGMHHCMSRVGMRNGAAMLPAIQNMMRLSSRCPLVDQTMTLAPSPNQVSMGHSPMWNPVNYQNQMQNSSFQEQYAKYMSFHSMPNTSQQTNMFNFGSHLVQQNHSPTAMDPQDDI